MSLPIVCSLANKTIRAKISAFIKNLSFDAPLEQRVLEYLIEVEGNVALGDFRSYLARCNFTDREVTEVLSVVKDYMLLDDAKLENTLIHFAEFYKKKMVSEVLERSAGNVDRLLEEFKSLKEFSPISEEYPVINLGSVNVSEVIKSEMGEDGADCLPSVLKSLRESTPWGGYIRGQVVMVVAAPGNGKTLLMLNEIVNLLRHGKKVFWVSLADMMTSDFITRISSIALQVPYFQVAVNPEKYFTEEIRELTKNLDIIILPPAFVTPSDIIQLVDTKASDSDVVVIDYDSNVKSESDNLYMEGDAVYTAGFHIARPPKGKNAKSKNRLVFIASQPKVGFWELEELPKECASESSRKQAIVDIMITIGRMTKSTQHIGVLSVVKQRRGGPKKNYYSVTDFGMFDCISKEDYAMTKLNSK